MRIVHVVAYVSDDGAYGGPSTVAITHCESLSTLGHDVSLVAGSNVTSSRVESVKGFNLHLLPAKKLLNSLGFATLFSRYLLGKLRQLYKDADVVHVHLARDTFTLLAGIYALLLGKKLIVQTHGMIDSSSRISAKVLDLLFVRKVLRHSKKVIALTEHEKNEIRKIEKLASVVLVPNGIPVEPLEGYDSTSKKIVFLSRLQSRKRPSAFIRMAAILHPKFQDLQFIIAGPDEGEWSACADLIADLNLANVVSLIGPIAPSKTNELLRTSRVFVLPSFGEVFPMVLLEAFSVGVPAVSTLDLGIVEICKRYGALLATDGSPEQLAEAVERLLTDVAGAERQRESAHKMVHDQMSIEKVSKNLLSVYFEVANAV